MRYLALLLAIAASAPGGRSDVCTSTFSIAAVDTATGEAGVAVASKVLSVGYIVPWADPRAGAVATQALANAGFGPLGLELLESGIPAEAVLDSLRATDPEIDQRQLGVVDMTGGSASFTGTGTLDWAGGTTGPGYAIQGNILVGPEVVDSMEAAFLASEGPLARRLLAALTAGDDAGGDSRGRQSAAMLVVRPEGGFQGSSDRLVDIRVADHVDPVGELARIYGLWEPTFMMQTYLDAGGEPETSWALDIMEDFLAGEDDPDLRANMLNNFAWTLATGESGREELALEMAQQAIELSPDDPNIMDTLATCHFVNGNREEAIRWEQRALELDPDNEFYRQQLERFRQ
jgi:uncharacterized Ntn-hydrolase superfamily protein